MASSEDNNLAVQAALHGAWIAANQGDPSLAASCVIAAASFTSGGEQRDLWDLVVTLDPSREGQWNKSRVLGDPVEIAAATMVLDARYGLELLPPEQHADTNIRDSISKAAELSGFDSNKSSSRLVAILAKDAADDPCRGRIFIPKRNPETRQMERVLCPEHSRPIGALGSDDEFIQLLRIEMQLRALRSGTWGSGGLPLRDPSIIELMTDYGISPTQPYWHDGRWNASP
ncbi:MAG: hypothetical protein JKY96_00995 [Phycisphaerales bacterium]|nr:hypothetical protein [Phycisphaerales bacterium]